MKAAGQDAKEGIPVWGATLSLNPRLGTLLNAWVTRFQSLALLLRYTSRDAFGKLGVSFCGIFAASLCFFNYRQLFLSL